MNLRTKRNLIVLLGVLLAAMGIYCGMFAYINPLRPDGFDVANILQTSSDKAERSTSFSVDFSNLAGKRMQRWPVTLKPETVDDETEEAAQPVVVIATPPPINVTNINRSSSRFVVSLKNKNSGETKTGVVGDEVFGSTIKEVDFERGRIRIEYQDNSHWVSLAR